MSYPETINLRTPAPVSPKRTRTISGIRTMQRTTPKACGHHWTTTNDMKTSKMHYTISPEVYFFSVAPIGTRPRHRRKNTTVEQEEGQQNKPARAGDLECQQTMPIENLVLALRFWVKSTLGSKMAAQPLHKALTQPLHNPYTTPLSISYLF